MRIARSTTSSSPSATSTRRSPSTSGSGCGTSTFDAAATRSRSARRSSTCTSPGAEFEPRAARPRRPGSADLCFLVDELDCGRPRRDRRARRADGRDRARSAPCTSATRTATSSSCSTPLVSCDVHARPLPRAARRGEGRRLPVRRLRPRARAGRPDPAPRRRPVARRGGRAGRGRGRGRRVVDVVPDDAVGLLQPRLARGRAGDRAAARARRPDRAPRGLAGRRPRRALRAGRRVAQPRSRVHDRADRRARRT